MDTTIPPLASIGIDIGKEVFHVVGFSTDGKNCFSSQDQATGAGRDLQKAASERRWHGGVPQRTLCQPGSAAARP